MISVNSKNNIEILGSEGFDNGAARLRLFVNIKTKELSIYNDRSSISLFDEDIDRLKDFLNKHDN